MSKGWSDWAAVPLRLVIGFGFVYHGFPKLFSGQGHAGFVGMLQNVGVPASGLAAWIVGIVEFFGGLLLIAGAFVAIVSILGILNMLVAMFAVHLPNGFNFIHITGMGEGGPTFGMPGFEVNLLYIAGFLALLFAGAGEWSVDRIRREKRGVTAAAGF